MRLIVRLLSLFHRSLSLLSLPLSLCLTHSPSPLCLSHSFSSLSSSPTTPVFLSLSVCLGFPSLACTFFPLLPSLYLHTTHTNTNMPECTQVSYVLRTCVYTYINKYKLLYIRHTYVRTYILISIIYDLRIHFISIYLYTHTYELQTKYYHALT